MRHLTKTELHTIVFVAQNNDSVLSSAYNFSTLTFYRIDLETDDKRKVLLFGHVDLFMAI